MGKATETRLYSTFQVFIRILVFSLRWAERLYFSFRQKLFHLKAVLLSGSNGQTITKSMLQVTKDTKASVYATYEAFRTDRLGIADSLSHHVFQYPGGHLIHLLPQVYGPQSQHHIHHLSFILPCEAVPDIHTVILLSAQTLTFMNVTSS